MGTFNINTAPIFGENAKQGLGSFAVLNYLIKASVVALTNRNME